VWTCHGHRECKTDQEEEEVGRNFAAKVSHKVERQGSNNGVGDLVCVSSNFSGRDSE
jgi:hypothetical protein